MNKINTLDGYVAFLDILGFSERVKMDSFPEDFEKYFKIINNAINHVSEIQYVTFSDSIILNTVKPDETCFLHLLQVTADIAYRFLIELGLPIRGSISRGRFWRAESENNDIMIAGPPIVDAYRYEQEQDWIGVMLSPQVIRKEITLQKHLLSKLPGSKSEARELEDRLTWFLLIDRYPEIPFHSANVLDDRYYDGFVLVPQCIGCSTPLNCRQDIIKYQEKLDQLMTFAPGTDSQTKYKRTKDWIENKVTKKLERLEYCSSWKKRHEKD